MSSHWFSANPDKAWVEKFFLIYSPIWMASMAMMVLTRWDKSWGDTAMLLHGLATALPVLLIPMLLASRYTRDSLEDKAENKRELQIAMGLKVNDKVPLFAVVSRLTSQKGLDLVLEALPGLLEQGGQLALLGAGDPVLQEGFLAAAAEHPGQVGVQIGYHEAFSHRIMGGADVILVPSRFEPCGLTQLYGLKYGTLPLVRRTGGLADTVSDSSLENLADGIASGFVFEDSNAWSLLRAIRRAFVLWSRPSLWRFVQRQAMAMDFSWQVAAKSYRELYYRLK